MGDATKIEWTEATWTPLRAIRADGFEDGTEVGWHCEKVSAGCQMCYAETLNMRLGTRQKYGSQSREAVRTYLDDRLLTQPLRWNRPRRIFVCSMTDLFGAWVPDGDIDRVFAVMALAGQHTFQVLTKRPERMRAYMTDPAQRDRLAAVLDGMDVRAHPVGDLYYPGSRAIAEGLRGGWRDTILSNVWLGTSVEDQAAADTRIPELLATPAAVRFLSCEPLIGPVDLHMGPAAIKPHVERIDWCIVGGESGGGARPMHINWPRWLVEQCTDAGVPVFVKQLGPKITATAHFSGGITRTDEIRFKDRKGGDPAEWPADLRVREYPTQEAR